MLKLMYITNRPAVACRTPKDLTVFPPDKVPVKTGQGFGAEV